MFSVAHNLYSLLAKRRWKTFIPVRIQVVTNVNTLLSCCAIRSHIFDTLQLPLLCVCFIAESNRTRGIKFVILFPIKPIYIQPYSLLSLHT
jgi:hypothetical protein